MSTHKHLDRICIGAAAVCLALALMLLCAGPGLTAPSAAVGYQNRLLDPSRVHTIAIVMEDWDGFLDTCENEEYVPCDLVIDGEASRSVGIRAKGNTSLRSVSQLDSSRYSFKIEFDHYVSGKSYYGLDKLSLNNLIQDNTLLKDYLVYRLMNQFSVDAPLCSFVWITVNGEDWGLYLAVEGVEEGFLQRTKGGQGVLYKPDSTDLGGGRGNGAAFSFDPEQLEDAQPEDRQFFRNSSQENGGPAVPFGGFDGQTGQENPSPAGGAPGQSSRQGGFGKGFNGGMMADGGRGSSDVKLQYIDDDPASYSNIFSNAKTAVDSAGQTRLIAALKRLSEGSDLENTLDMDQVLRYFVVHSFVVNGDSYTGSMIHNYYLYERNGRLAMVPWDYNLAFGGFQGAASQAVNDPIDQQLSDRPMQSWIFSDEAFLRQYHQLYAAFAEQADWEGLIEQAAALIAPYVEKDPTKFCTCEEFQTGVEALKTFCRLRAESVRGQLAGEIPSDTQGQSQAGAGLIDASGLNLADMGNMGMNNGKNQRQDFSAGAEAGQPAFPAELPDMPGGGVAPPAAPQEGADPNQSAAPGAGAGGFSPGRLPDGANFQEDGQSQRQSGRGGFDPFAGGDFAAPPDQPSGGGQSGWPLLAVSAAVLLAGLAAAWRFRR